MISWLFLYYLLLVGASVWWLFFAKEKELNSVQAFVGLLLIFVVLGALRIALFGVLGLF